MRMIRPNEMYLDDYLAACREAIEGGVTEWMPVAADRFDSWRANAMRIYAALESGEGLPPGMLRMETHWRVEDGRFVGEVQLRPFLTADEARSIGHIGYAVRPSMWGRGVGTELLTWAVERLRALGVERIYIVCNVDNAGSNRVAAKAGFRLVEARGDGETAERLYVI